MNFFIYTYMIQCMYICIPIHIHMYIYVYIILFSKCMHTHARTHTHTHTHTHIHTYKHTRTQAQTQTSFKAPVGSRGNANTFCREHILYRTHSISLTYQFQGTRGVTLKLDTSVEISRVASLSYVTSSYTYVTSSYTYVYLTRRLKSRVSPLCIHMKTF